MNWKELLRPTLPKIGLMVVLFLIVSFLWEKTHFVTDVWFFGYPFPVIETGGLCPPAECENPIYFWDGLAINAVFWYLVSAIILKITKK